MATIISIGTASPPTFINQRDYPDFFFRSTNTEHNTRLKQKFTRICEKSLIRKRHVYITDDVLKEFPALGIFGEPSLDTREEIMAKEVPKLGMEAAVKAMNEWGQPKSSVTHLIFCSSSGTSMPGGDLELARLLGLSPSTKRTFIHFQGCIASCTALRLAKDIAENDKTARILVVCSESTVGCFHAPHEDYMDMLVGSALYADGATAAMVGADLKVSGRAQFKILSSNQTIIPGTKDEVRARPQNTGYSYGLSKNLPRHIKDNVEECIRETVKPYGITDFKSLFYAVHPGGPHILDAVQGGLCLKEDQLNASWHVLSEYGNMWSSSAFFVLDEMRKRSVEDGKGTTGDGKEFGVLLSFGPGITVDTVMLGGVDTTNY